uniref:Opine dehydrogenase domain-containing protein n=1 Tax=Noctiluca scintillans TaxID=2966 RepID=A0A7S1ABZ8_NOCSC|eukprot:CAMPEP_0194481014 /NCGR_PEP_ID=MMETSP0253-20130528/3631_1 /TAXON_ID=2966 /ORGANISM="Noctiluca scintillans" /LENGTH=410 /DNA_ID=CAMNT_0039320469 /DNA_START=40 /DNA_END=1272 /DNA_ORIENTATION=-
MAASDEKANPFSVLICGGGNAAQVAASMFAARYDTYAISLFADEALDWKRALSKRKADDDLEGMELTLDTGRKLRSLPKEITKDPSIVSKVNIVVLAVPSFAHAQYFEAFAPHMQPGTIVAVMPARSGGDILFSSILGAKAQEMVFVGFETLPWACRFTEWGRRATILGTKENILAAVTPPSQAKRALSALQGLLGVFPKIDESPTNLGISLRNPGAVIHPGVMYGRWCEEKWDGTPVAEKPLFYQGVDGFTEQVLLGLTTEIQEVKKAIAQRADVDLNDACTLYQWYMDCYSTQISDKSTLQTAMATCSAYTGLTHPMIADGESFMPDLKYRYLAEDVPTGLCFMKGLAELFGVPTPTMDRVVTWAQKQIGKEILVDGKCTGKDIQQTRAPQGVGITTPEAFLKASGIV